MNDQTDGLKKRLPIWLALIWLASLTISYAYFHSPLAANTALALGRAAADLLATAMLVTLGGALGTMVTGGLASLQMQVRPAVQALLGLGLLALIVLAVGVAGLFPPQWLGWVVTTLLLALFGRWALAWLRSISEAIRLTFEPLVDRFPRWLRIGVLIMLGLAMVLGLAPPTMWDALTYHLAGPQAYLTAGRIIAVPENHFLGFPQIVEMLYLWLMILARPQAAALLHWWMGVFALLITLGLARHAGRPAAGWIAVAALLVGESLWAEFTYAYNDLALLAFVIAALALVLTWGQEPKQDNLLLVAGMLVGLAMGVKYTAVGAAVGVGVLGVWLARRGGIRTMLRTAALLVFPALLAFAPWLVKNAILLGNPVAPLAFETLGFDELDQWYYLRPGTGLGVGQILIAPIQATVFGVEDGAPYQAASGALVAGLIPLVALGWRQKLATERALIISLCLFIVPGYVLWAVGLGVSWYLVQTRLLFPIFPATALIGALGLEGLSNLDIKPLMVWIGRGLVLIALTFAIAAGLLTVINANPLPIITGFETEDSYLVRTLGAHAVAMQEVNDLPSGSKVLFLWEPRVFYCRQECIPDSMINQWWHDRQIEPDPLQIAEGWRARGVTHILIFETGMQLLFNEEPFEPLTQEDLDALDVLREEAMLVLWGGDASAGHYTLYQLRSNSP